jgi:hypothetical protein
MTTPSHSGLHTNSNDAVVAIETFVGTTGAPNFAKLGSPHFTGTPTAPTNATATDATTQLATDAFVQNAVAAYAAPGLRLIYVDELGADPTGVNDSSAVIRTKQTALGSAAYLLVFGAGTYLMSSAFVNFGPDQGAIGVTSTITNLSWSGSGPLITATNAVFSDSARAGRFGGFSINGPYGSGTTSGFQYSNLQSIIIDDVLFYGLPGGAVIGANPGGGYAEEGQLTRLSMSECGLGSGYVFQFRGTSFDYSKIDAVVVVEANIDVLSLVGGAAMQGLNLSLRGNCHGGTGSNTGAIVAIDRGGASGISNLRNATFNVAMEANDSPGVVGHYLYWNGSHNAASQFSAQGVFHLFAAGATCQGGVGGNATFNSYFNPASFAGITNDIAGGDMSAGDSFVFMGGTDWTTVNVGTIGSQSGAGSTLTVYWQFGDVNAIALGTGANTIVFQGANGFVKHVELFLVQPSSGTAATVTWPSSVKWPAATAPTLSTASGYVDKFRFTYIPGNAFWYGELVGVHYG